MDHNNDKGMKSMMWIMLICCGAPLLAFLFIGAGGIAVGASKWLIIGIIALMIIAHIFIMRRGHKHNDGVQQVEGEKKDDGKGKDGHSGHSCCH